MTGGTEERTDARRHPVDPVVAAELPGLELWSRPVPVTPGASPGELRRRLRDLSGRWTGARVVALRSQPVAHAYRVFFRHTGVDPDETPVPIEQAARERMFHGGFPTRSLLHDALLIALVETGIPVWALDEDAIRGDLRLRNATADDAAVPARRLVVADDERPLAVLFGEVVAGAGVYGATQAARLFAVAVGGIAAMAVEEALDVAAEALRTGAGTGQAR